MFLANLISWTGWTREDWLELVNKRPFKIFASIFIIALFIFGAFGLEYLIRFVCWLIIQAQTIF